MKDCAIVLGYPANEDGTISNILKSRIDGGIELFQSKKVKYLILSGGSIHNNYSEAETMYNYALSKGIPEDCLLLENIAKSTYHNILYSKEIMEKYQLKNCYVVTNSWHIIKGKHYAKKFNLDYEMVKCHKPEGMSYLKVLYLTLWMPCNMFKMRLKGFY